jgi:hypothetical protein
MMAGTNGNGSGHSESAVLALVREQANLLDSEVKEIVEPLQAKRESLHELRAELISAREDVDKQIARLDRILKPLVPAEPMTAKAQQPKKNGGGRGFTDAALIAGATHILSLFDQKEHADELPFLTVADTLREQVRGYNKANAYKIIDFLRAEEVLGLAGKDGNTNQFRLMDRPKLERFATPLVEA